MQTRNIDLDALKGIAIVAVILYHLGILPFGYLGVDIFLVINGYFITHSMLYQFNQKKFSYTDYLKKKLVRLWPLIILASLLSLFIGYFAMLPDDYENLSQSVVASSFFANNILSAITTNYWDVATSYKPLMHMWYVGIIVQCYVIFPLIVWGIAKCRKNTGLWLLIALAITFAALYFFPFFNATQKFYFLPFRLFEFLIGAVVAAYISDVKYIKSFRPLYILSTILLVVLCTLSLSIISPSCKVLIVSVLTGGGYFVQFILSNTSSRHSQPTVLAYCDNRCNELLDIHMASGFYSFL